MNTEKKQRLDNIVEQQKKLQEFALANGIDEAIVNMGATADINDLYEIMYSYDADEEEDEEECVCGECGISTKGRKIRGLWDNKLCEECGEHSDIEEEEEFEDMCDCCVKPEYKPEYKTCVVCYVEKSTYEIGIDCKTCKNPMCFVCCCEYSLANQHFDCESDETGTCAITKIPCPMCRTINIFCV